MPNDCRNGVTIYATPPTIELLKEVGLKLPTLLKEHTLPEDLRMYEYTLHEAGTEAMIFTVESAWAPLHPLFEALMKEYPISFIKNSWYVEDGTAGVWIAEAPKTPGAPPEIKSLEWEEGCVEAKMDMFRKSAV
jgi:hypothetical protein